MQGVHTRILSSPALCNDTPTKQLDCLRKSLRFRTMQVLRVKEILLAEVYDQVLKDLDEIGCLSEDGQTNVGALLSISSRLMNWDDARRGGHPD